MAKTPFAETSEERLKRYKRAVNRIEKWFPFLEEAYRYVHPNKEIFFEFPEDTTRGESTTNEIFDSTPEMGLQGFANNVQSLILPPHRHFASLKAGPDVPDEQVDALNEELQKITNQIFKWINLSNLNLVSNESFMELGIGTAIIRIEEGTDEEPFSFTSIDLAQVAFEGGPNQSIENVWRKMRLPVRLIKRTWPGSVIPAEIGSDENVEVEVIEGVIFYPENDKDSRFFYYVQLMGGKDVFTEFRNYSPFTVGRYSVRTNELVGRGPALIALNDIKVLNTMAETELKSARFKFDPPWLINTGSAMNPFNINITPGTPIYVDGSLQGAIEPLSIGGDPNFIQLSISDLRARILKIMLANPMPTNPVPGQTATDATLRQQEWIRNSGIAIGRLIREFVQPIVEKVIIILQKKGLLDLSQLKTVDKLVIDNKIIELRLNTPLADVQNLDEIKKMEDFAQFLGMVVGPVGGMPPSVFALKTLDIADWAANKFNIDLELVRDRGPAPEFTMTQLMQNIQQQAAGAQMPPGEAPGEAQQPQQPPPVGNLPSGAPST